MVSVYCAKVVGEPITPQLIVCMLQLGLYIDNDVICPLPSFPGTGFQWAWITYSIDGIAGGWHTFSILRFGWCCSLGCGFCHGWETVGGVQKQVGGLPSQPDLPENGNTVVTVAIDLAEFSLCSLPPLAFVTMPKSKSSEKVLCSCGCGTRVSRRTQTRHLQGNGPTLALAEVFETRDYFGTTYANSSGVGHSVGEVHPPKRCRIATPDPRSPLAQPSPRPTSNLNGPSRSDTPAINPDDVLAGRWTGHSDGDDSEDGIGFEGHPIPELVEVSGDEGAEESELDSEDQWDDGVVEEDPPGVLEMNVELDACDAGAWHLQVPRPVR